MTSINIGGTITINGKVIENKDELIKNGFVSIDGNSKIEMFTNNTGTINNHGVVNIETSNGGSAEMFNNNTGVINNTGVMNNHGVVNIVHNVEMFNGNTGSVINIGGNVNINNRKP